MRHVAFYLLLACATSLAVEREGKSASPKLKIDSVPMIVVEGQPVSGGVRIAMNGSTTYTSEATFTGSQLQHAWTQTSDIDTTTQQFKEVVTGEISGDFAESISGSGSISASLGIKGHHSDTSTNNYDSVEVRKRDEEELRDAQVSITNFNKQTSSITFTQGQKSGYARTGLIVRNYTDSDADLSQITDELEEVDLITGKPTTNSLSFHNPIRTADSGGYTDPTGPVPSNPLPTLPLAVVAPASVAGKFGHLEIPLYYEGLDAFQAKSAFNSYNVFRERVTNYTLKWQGHSFSKSQVDQQISAAKANDIQIRIVDEENGLDTIRFLKPQPGANDLEFLDAIAADGHKVTLDSSGKSIVSLDNKANNLDLHLTPLKVTESLSNGMWKLLQAHDGQKPTEILGADLKTLKIKAGDSFVIYFVTLRDILRENLVSVTSRFDVAHADGLWPIGGSGPWTLGSALWTDLKTAGLDFPLNLGPSRKCLFTDDNFPLRSGDHIGLKLRSAWRDLQTWPTNTVGTYFQSEYHLPAHDVPFFNAFVATEYELRGDTVIVPDVVDPDKTGISISFGTGSPLLPISTAINAGAGRFFETADGMKYIEFTVTPALIGSVGGPICLQFTRVAEKGIAHGRDYKPKDFGGGGHAPSVAIPIPGEVLKALFDWKSAYPLSSNDVLRPQEWTVEVTKQTLPWK